MGTDAAQLKRHGDERRVATLVATVTQLEATATDGTLGLLELLVVTELAGKARQEADKQALTCSACWSSFAATGITNKSLHALMTGLLHAPYTPGQMT